MLADSRQNVKGTRPSGCSIPQGSRYAERARWCWAGHWLAALALVGMDGGWVSSRERKGGMEGKVGVMATEVEDMGGGRRRLSGRQYVATFGDSERLGILAYGVAEALGGEEAKRQQVLADGTNGIKTQAELHFPRALKTLEWGHVGRWCKKQSGRHYLVALSGRNARSCTPPSRRGCGMVTWRGR